MSRHVKIDLIDPSPWARFFPHDEEHIARLAEDIATRGIQTPLHLYPRGERFEVLAGHDRLEAARRCGLTEVPAEMRSTLTSEEDRWSYFVKDNSYRKDAKQAAARAVLDRHPEWSDLAVSRISGLSDKTVGTLRAEMVARSEIPNACERVDTNGRVQPAHKPPRTPPLRTDKSRPVPVPERADDVAGDAPAAPAPPTTERQCQKVDAHKRRLIAGLSQIGGLVQGLAGLDPQKLHTACSDDEVETWAGTAAEHARSLLAVSASLDAGAAHDTPDLADELERANRDNARLEALNTSLSATDLAAEVAAWSRKYAQLEGRLRDAVTKGNEAERTARHATKLLREIREALRVERNAEIVPVLRKLLP